MTRKILIPLDGSPSSEKALTYAAELAPNDGDELFLVHVIPEREVPEAVKRFAAAEHLNGPPEYIYEKHIAENLLRAARDTLREATPARITMMVAHGEPAVKILEQAKQSNADHIVMGTRGINELEELVFGSVAHKVTHLASYQTNATVVVIK